VEGIMKQIALLTAIHILVKLPKLQRFENDR
jgi:hypothetical protein